MRSRQDKIGKMPRTLHDFKMQGDLLTEYEATPNASSYVPDWTTLAYKDLQIQEQDSSFVISRPIEMVNFDLIKQE